MTLVISNLVKTYSGNLRALDGLNLRVEQGLFGLLGPNGSGKSTLMKILATLLEADAGTVHLDGVDLIRQPELVRRSLGYLPQSFGAYPNMTAYEILDYLATMKGIGPKAQRKREVEGQLAAVNLFDVRHQKAESFSGGMLRRLGLAQATLAQPRLLIVDEPTTGLDPLERQSLYQYLAQTAKDRTVILATHLVQDVRSLCKDIAVLGAGRILGHGHPEELISQVQGNLWCKPAKPQEIEELRQHLRVTNTRWEQRHLFVDVLQSESPGPDFRQKDVDLRDAYFAISGRASSRESPARHQALAPSSRSSIDHPSL